MPKLEDSPFDRPMFIGFGLTLLMLLLVGGLLWLYGLQSAASGKQLDHTREVLAMLEDFRADINSAEHSQWGYFLTKDKTFLAQRDAEIGKAGNAMAKLQELTRDSQRQQKCLSQLKIALDKRVGILLKGQAVFELEGFNAAKGAFNVGHNAMIPIHRLLRDAELEEINLLNLRRGHQLSTAKNIGFGIVFVLLLVAVVLLWMRSAIRNRLAVEQALQAAQKPLLKVGALQDAIFNNPNFSCIATDVQGLVQIFNVGAERMLGYRAIDVVGKMTPTEMADVPEMLMRANALGQEFNTPVSQGFEALAFKASRGIEDIYELTYIREDGRRVPSMVAVTTLRDDQAKIIGYLFIATDNSARKQVEAEQAALDQRLRDQQFYTRSLIESNIDALMATDPRGIISDVNQQMEALTGCTRDELIGAPFKNYFTDPERAEVGINRVLREGKVTNYELTAHDRNGRETVVSWNATTFYDRDRKLQGVFAAARDVTERKQFEHMLQANNLELVSAKAAAEKANLAKSEFLSSMSHELRSPLNAVLGFAQLMASEKPPPSAAQKLSIDQILQAGWYLLRLINEILDLAMIESGKVTVSMEPMSLQDVLDDCKAMIEPQAAKRGIRLMFPRSEEPIFILADCTRVKQVLINLLSNAIKYNREGGTAIIQCTRFDPGRVRVSITDTGEGLASAQLAQLFQPFNRLGQENSNKEGTGIGLVVTKQLVELMGGAIGVESSVGVGSIFWFDLAASIAPEVKLGDGNTEKVVPVEAIEYNLAPARRTILYVEDNPANMALVEQLIARRTDLSLLCATNGHSGVQMARISRPDMILMDINLPGISGYDALKLLREDPDMAHIPVMALSANAIPSDIARGLEAGFFRYLTKPINVDEFMDAIDAALSHAGELPDKIP